MKNDFPFSSTVKFLQPVFGESKEMSRNQNEKTTISDEIVALGMHSFNLTTNELRDDKSNIVLLRNQSAEVLAELVKSPGITMSKAALIDAVWADTFVTDDSLVQCIVDIRRALGGTGSDLIETFPKKGYRLNVGKLTESAPKILLKRWLWMSLPAIALVALIGFAYWFVSQDSEIRVQPVIAVMAFEDQSNGSHQGFLSDAISEGIIIELSRFKEFSVIARDSSFKYRSTTTDVRQISDELGVHYVLAGSQQTDGDHLRVTVELIDARSGINIWAENYDRKLEDFFDVQSEIVRTVASSVGFKIAYNPPPNGGLNRLSALRYHLEARSFLRKKTEKDAQKAEELNLKAIEADPNSPYGYIGLGFVYQNRFIFDWGPLDSVEKLALAEYYADKALELGPNNYSSHYVRAFVHIDAGERNQAIARFKQSMKLNPSDSNVRMGLATAMLYDGNIEEALINIEYAMAINPLHDDWFYWVYSWALWESGDCSAASQAIQKIAKLPNKAHLWLSAIQVCLGQYDAAVVTIAKFLENKPDYTLTRDRQTRLSKFKSPAQLDRWHAALRVAGMPE